MSALYKSFTYLLNYLLTYLISLRFQDTNAESLTMANFTYSTPVQPPIGVIHFAFRGEICVAKTRVPGLRDNEDRVIIRSFVLKLNSVWSKFLQFLGYPSFILIHCSFCLEQGVTDPQTLRAVSRFCTYRSLDPSMCAINAMYIIIYAPPFVIIVCKTRHSEIYTYSYIYITFCATWLYPAFVRIVRQTRQCALYRLMQYRPI